MAPTCSQPGKPRRLRHPPERRLEPDQRRRRRRGCAPSRRRRCRAPTGPRPLATAAAAPPLEPPGVRVRSHGIARDAEERIVGQRLVAELRGVGLAEDDRARRPSAGRRRRCPPPAPDRRTGASRRSCAARACRATSLSDSGTPCSGPSGSPFMTAISASRAAARAWSAVDQAEGVQPRVERLDAGEQRRGELDGRELLVTDEGGELESGSPGEIVVDHGLRLCTQEIVSSGRERRRRRRSDTRRPWAPGPGARFPWRGPRHPHLDR